MSIYKSHTHGPIPLSAEGKRLLQKLREVIGIAIKEGEWNNAVSHARGELAKYMSKLETENAIAYRARQPSLWSTDAYKKLLADMRKDNESVYKYTGTLKENLIQGNNITGMILDDPQNEQELDMSKKAVAARKKVAQAEVKMQLIGVRFFAGHNLAKIYTYKAKRAVKLHLGQEVVVYNESGTTVAVIVQIDQPMPFGYAMESIKELTAKVAPL